LGTAAPIPAAHHAERTTLAGIALVQTFWNVALICSNLRSPTPSSCESRANNQLIYTEEVEIRFIFGSTVDIVRTEGFGLF
jgi:hypothetical protein